MRYGIIVLCMAAASTAAASDGDVHAFAGYLALSNTPIGLVGPEAPETEGPARGIKIGLRYGRTSRFFDDDTSVHAPALAIGLPAGGGRLTMVASRPSYCTEHDCSSDIFVAGLGWNRSVARRASADHGRPDLSVGVAPSVGSFWTTKDGFDHYLLSAHLGVPLAATVGRKTRVSLYAVPGVGWGRYEEDRAHISGTRGTIGGGLAVTTSSGLGLNVGAHRVLIRRASTQLGVGVSWQSDRRP
jgi:hypothetical protein